jgi:hypothetical protein
LGGGGHVGRSVGLLLFITDFFYSEKASAIVMEAQPQMFVFRFGSIQIAFLWFCIYLAVKVVLTLYALLVIIYNINLWRKSVSSDLTLNLLLLSGSMFFVFLLIELFFVFYPTTDTTGSSMGYRNFEIFYTRLRNEDGFRDFSWTVKNKKAEKSIVFIGDSYTKGFGLKDTSVRFSNLVVNKLGGRWEGYNMGSTGSATSEQLPLLSKLPVTPTVLVWQYLFNDPDDVCNEALHNYPDLDMYKGLNPVSLWIVTHSYFANYVYFRFHSFPQFFSFKKFINDCTTSQIAMQNHYAQLDSVVSFCKNNNVRLLPVVIPFMSEPWFGAVMEDSVCSHFTSVGCPPVLLRQAALQTPLPLRSISKYDAHPSAYFSVIIADSILNRVKAMNLE